MRTYHKGTTPEVLYRHSDVAPEGLHRHFGFAAPEEFHSGFAAVLHAAKVVLTGTNASTFATAVLVGATNFGTTFFPLSL